MTAVNHYIYNFQNSFLVTGLDKSLLERKLYCLYFMGSSKLILLRFITMMAIISISRFLYLLLNSYAILYFLKLM